MAKISLHLRVVSTYSPRRRGWTKESRTKARLPGIKKEDEWPNSECDVCVRVYRGVYLDSASARVTLPRLRVWIREPGHWGTRVQDRVHLCAYAYRMTHIAARPSPRKKLVEKYAPLDVCRYLRDFWAGTRDSQITAASSPTVSRRPSLPLFGAAALPYRWRCSVSRSRVTSMRDLLNKWEAAPPSPHLSMQL